MYKFNIKLFTGPTQADHWAARLAVQFQGCEVLAGTEHVYVRGAVAEHHANVREDIAAVVPWLRAAPRWRNNVTISCKGRL